LCFTHCASFPQSEIMTVVGSVGGSTLVTWGWVVGAPVDTKPLTWSVYRLRLISVSASPVAYFARVGACQSAVSSALAICCHIPVYAAVACWRALSAGESGEGVMVVGTGAGTVAPPGVDDVAELQPAAISIANAMTTSRPLRRPLPPCRFPLITYTP
jgi:hypothetical protein